MPSERSRVQHPLWRKKVDGSLFQHRMTILPVWVYRDVFRMTPGEFSSSKSDPSTKIKVKFRDGKNTSTHHGWITSTNFSEENARQSATLRFIFSTELAELLQRTFPMSHFREIERRLREQHTTTAQIEEEYPFFEFLDIEWDAQNRCMHLTCHFTTPMQFSAVFQRLLSDGVVDRIERELRSGENRVHVTKTGWRPREEMEREEMTTNVIYTLIDTENHELYVGEAENLRARFSQDRHEIPGWTHYRYDRLPEGTSREVRQSIERMAIRQLASLMENDGQISGMNISTYRLKNRRIDR